MNRKVCFPYKHDWFKHLQPPMINWANFFADVEDSVILAKTKSVCKVFSNCCGNKKWKTKFRKTYFCK